MPTTIRLAVRDWDFITPLALGDVKPDGFTLQVERVADLPKDLATDPLYDAGEMSMSRYCLGIARGETGIVGVPHFIMRGFRHRCIIAARNNPINSIAQLAGARIGLAGWQDSGNTWTRAILRREGIEVADARWFVSRLNASHPIIDRLGGYGQPGLIETVPGDRPVLELLAEGALEAVFMPFMPPDFYSSAGKFRQLLPDFRQAEVAYAKDVGYVPGMHLLGIKPEIARAHPWLAQALSDILAQSSKVWWDKRLRYADTTPWLLDEMRQVSHDLPATWEAQGFAANEKMIDDFAAELQAQGLTPRRMTPRDLFPMAV